MFPDFLALNKRTRKQFIYEHFGLMHEQAYVERTTEKFVQYERNGIMPGDNLLFTMEYTNMPINSRIVESMIKQYLL